MFKLHHVRDLLAIAQARSVRGAARALGLAQPALTRSLRELEQQLGVQLVQRHARGVVLTPAGERFALRASAAMEDLRRAQEEAGQAAGQMQGAVSVGLSGVAIMALLPVAYAAFRARCPEVRLRVVEGPFPLLESRLRDGTLDFYVGPRHDRQTSTEWHAQRCCGTRRCIVARRGHPLRRVRSLQRLVPSDWLLTGVREHAERELEELFAEHGLPAPRMRTRVDSLLAMLSLLTSTDAVALLPNQVVDSAMFRQQVVALPVREPLGALDIMLVNRAGLPLTPAATVLAEQLMRAG